MNKNQEAFFKACAEIRRIRQERQEATEGESIALQKAKHIKEQADKEGFNPQEIERIKENQELLTGNLKLAQTMLNNFLGAHYKSAYLKHGGER